MEAKERILVKANELFHRYGIRSVSMDDIAAQLGMSKKTLYQYYTDKDELVHAVFDVILATNKNNCIECTKKGDNAIHEVFLSFDIMEEMLKTMNPSVLFDMHKYHPAAYRKFEEFKNSFLYKIIKGNLDRGVKEELYRNDIDTDILTRYRLYSVLLSFNPEVFPTVKTNAAFIEQQLIECFVYGLATPKGYKLIEKYKNQRTKK
ncbi:MAG TPA: TetR/AcrR family transcriptional regulator [Flavisolibacter sp.]|jgi:AcrR family transcriptional regulator|nr:TetR/AcrR family transcriptional regulator [Flavisolibacter sp.]